MKKVLITMAVLASMVAGAMVFSSFTTPKQDVKEGCSQIKANVPTYWEGYAFQAYPDGSCSNRSAMFISVYQAEGSCNSFYVKTKDGQELWVKTNPNYDPDNGSTWLSRQNYYVTCGNGNYYFNM